MLDTTQALTQQSCSGVCLGWKENGPSSTDYRRETQKRGKPSSINDGSSSGGILYGAENEAGQDRSLSHQHGVWCSMVPHHVVPL